MVFFYPAWLVRTSVICILCFLFCKNYFWLKCLQQWKTQSSKIMWFEFIFFESFIYFQFFIYLFFSFLKFIIYLSKNKNNIMKYQHTTNFLQYILFLIIDFSVNIFLYYYVCNYILLALIIYCSFGLLKTLYVFYVNYFLSKKVSLKSLICIAL